MNALTPKEVADLRLWRPGEPGLIHVPFRLWQRILDALDGAPASTAPEASCRVCGSRAHDTGNPCGGASAEPGGAAPSDASAPAERAARAGTDSDLVREARNVRQVMLSVHLGRPLSECALSAIGRLITAVEQLDGAPATARSAAPDSSEGGGGGAPAAGEREAREIVLAALNRAEWYVVADRPEWKERVADLVAPAIAAALRAPAPPTPPPHES